MVLIGLIVGAASAGLSQLARARTASEGRAQAMERAHTAAELIARDIAQSVRDSDLLYARVYIEPGGDADDARDELLVHSRTLRPARPWAGAPEGSEKEIQYRVRPDAFGLEQASSAGETLWRRADPVPDDEPLGGGVASAMVDGVLSINLEAFDGGVWMDLWDSDYDGYPYAVRVTITATDDTGTYRATSRRVAALDRVPVPPTTEDVVGGGGR